MAESEIRDSIRQLKSGAEPRRRTWRGWMVDFEGVGSAKVSDSPGYVYVRVDRGQGDVSGDVVQAFSRIRPVAGWPVIIGTTPYRDWEYTVLEVDVEALGGAIDGEPIVEPHHQTHEWGAPSGSDDVVFARFAQLYDFSVWPESGLNIKIGEGVYDPSGTKAELAYSTLDLSPYQPAYDQRYVLICLSPSGTFEVVPGIIKPFLTLYDVPSAPSDDHWELAAVRIKAWDTQIVHTPKKPNIVDLRFAGLGWARGGSGTHDPLTLETCAENLLELVDQELDVKAQPSGTVYASPTSADGCPTFRFLTDSDVPDVHAHYPGSIELEDLAVDVATQAELDAHEADVDAHHPWPWEDVLVVDKSGVTDADANHYPTIADALSAASAGDTISIMPGTYTEDVTLSTENVSLVGIAREDVTIIGLVTVSATGCSIESLSISNVGTGVEPAIQLGANIAALDIVDVHAYGVGLSSGSGIGIYIDTYTVTTLRIHNSWVQGYSATGTGYGIYIGNASGVVALGTRFDGSHGGTGSEYDIRLSHASATLDLGYCAYASIDITGTLTHLDAADGNHPGTVELATSAETQTGTDLTRAVTPAGLRADVPTTPAASRGARLDGSGDLLLPSGGDVLHDGHADTDAGLGRMLETIFGDLDTAKVRTASPEHRWGYPTKDASWETWALGLTSGELKGSDEFLQLNYGAGTSQWADVGSAAPYSVTVSNSILYLTAKKSNDSSSTHAAIYTPTNSVTQASALLRPTGLIWDYPNYGSDTIGHWMGAGWFDSSYLHGVFWWLEVPQATKGGTGQTWEWTMYMKRYYHASTAWNPATTGTAAWTTNWTTLKYWTIPIRPLNLYLYPRTAVNRIYYGFGTSVFGSFQVRDIQSVTMSGNFDRFVIFQCRSPHTTARYAGHWDYVRLQTE